MTHIQWLSLALICWLGAATPGPSLVVILRISLAKGIRSGLLASWSHALAIGFYAFLSLLFYSALQATSSLWFITLVVLGQVWLLWLGSTLLWHLWTPPTNRHPAPTKRFSEHWSQGLFIGLLNPKIWLFFTAIFSPFIANVEASLVSLALLPLIIDGLWYSLIACAVNRPQWADLLNRSERIRDTVLGLVLVIFALIALSDSIPNGRTYFTTL